MGRSEMKKKCELCKAKARIHCESDHASLCWDCDAKVHSANFLVARHSRNLLCRICQSPTPWSAAGAKLGATVSICEQCVDDGRCDDSGGEESAEELEAEVVEENQVVPWSPPTESSSSVEEYVSGEDDAVSKKRIECDPPNPSPLHTDRSSSSIDVSGDRDDVVSRKRFRNYEEDRSYASSHVDIFDLPPSDSTAGMAEMLSRTKTTPPQKIQILNSGRVVECGSGILDLLSRFNREETVRGEGMAEF